MAADTHALDVPQHRPHADRKGLDLPQAGECVWIELGFAQQKQLGLGEEGRERIGEVVPQSVEPLVVAHTPKIVRHRHLRKQWGTS